MDIPQRQIELARPARQQRRLGGCGAARGETALGGFHDAEDDAAAAHGEFGDKLAIIRNGALHQAVECQFIARKRNRLRRS